MILMPDHRTYFVYTNDGLGYSETVLAELRGIYGTHLFGSVWKVSGPGYGGLLDAFGLRIYPSDSTPVLMEMQIVDKVILGEGEDPSLPPKGDRTRPLLLFSDQAIRFEDMWLEREPTSPELVEALGSALGAE